VTVSSPASASSSVSLASLAERLDDAARNARAISQLSEPLTLAEAYDVQRRSIERRLARGERRTGLKMGFTSKAKMLQMGLDELIWGRLTDGMLVDDGAAIDFARYVHPRVEPEIAFLLKRPLAGRVTMPEALGAVEAVCAALEIIDSRYENFKFSLTDVVADNSSASGYVLGPWGDPRTDVANLGMVLEIDGRAVAIGSSAAILDHPLRSLVAAARLAAEAGETLEAGWIVMAGGATAAEALAPGCRVRLSVERLGDTGFTVR
jgi:2-oxo-3-hexenedioate decarboxylase